MKTKTKVWFEIARNDMEFAEDILRNKKRPYYAAHFCHQAIEKLLKAIVTENANETPFLTHNFRLLIKQAKIRLPNNKMETLLDIAPHYLPTKYPEDIKKLYKQYSLNYVQKLLIKQKRYSDG